MFNPWFALGLETARLTWEAQMVIALRMMRLAAGGARSRSEARRLVSEKMEALAEAGTTTASVLLSDGSSHKAAKRVLTLYKNRVRRNRRRLSK